MASAGIEGTIADKTVSLLVVDPHYDIENNAESLAEFKKSLKVDIGSNGGSNYLIAIAVCVHHLMSVLF